MITREQIQKLYDDDNPDHSYLGDYEINLNYYIDGFDKAMSLKTLETEKLVEAVTLIGKFRGNDTSVSSGLLNECSRTAREALDEYKKATE